MTRFRPALLLAALFALAPAGAPSAGGVAPLSAQVTPVPDPRSTAELRALARSVADLWSGDAVRRLEPLLAPGGIGFHVGQVRQSTLEPRMAVAALEDLLDSRRTVSCAVVRVGLSAGDGDSGSAELTWESLAPGTDEVLRRTVFLGFALEGDRWRISEIRVLP